MSKSPLIVTALVAIIVLVGTPSVAQAASGDINLTYSPSGFTADPSESPDGIIALRNGKSLVAATASNSSTGTGTKSYVARLLSDGTLDGSFGGGGIVTLVNVQSEAAPNYTSINAMLELVPSAQVLVAVYHPLAAGNGTTVVRLNPNGTVDTLFGDGGYADVPVPAPGTGVFSASSMTLQQDASGPIRILIAGDLTTGGSAEALVVALRLDGTLDTSWAAGGYLQPITADSSRVDNITTDAEGSLFLLSNEVHASARVTKVSKFAVDGSAISSFGVSGETVLEPETDPLYPSDSGLVLYGHSISLDHDDNLVVLGQQYGYSTPSYTGHRRLVLQRLLPDGSTDISFASDGRFASAIAGNDTSVVGAQIDPAGVIFVAGIMRPDGDRASFVAAFTADGILDERFAPGGVASYVPVNQYDGFLSGLALTTNGLLLSIAKTVGSGQTHVQVVSFDGNIAADPVTPDAVTPDSTEPVLAATGFPAETFGFAALLLLALGVVLLARRTVVISRP